MKKKLLMYALTFAVMFMFSVSTANAWYISLETIGEVEVEAGDTFYAYVYFNADEGSSNQLSLYTFAVGYDTDELEWVSSTAAQQLTQPSPLFPFMTPSYDEDEGYIDDWVAMGMAAATVTGKVQLAKIEFTVLDTEWDGELDVWLLSSAGGDGTINVDGVAYSIFNGYYNAAEGPDVGSAAPVPGAGLLLGAGLLSLVGIGRSKTRN